MSKKLAAKASMIQFPGDPPAPAAVMQGGMNNAELSDAWAKKLPGVVPTDREMTAFALGDKTTSGRDVAATESGAAA